eukprot:c17725_g1_i4.p1 GENE.c17725_g1_i4~~c17725_g1_i4.p1  ORF type:complete len:1315 (+),score=307.04 c17725_g1_i4:559-3945(+)
MFSPVTPSTDDKVVNIYATQGTTPRFDMSNGTKYIIWQCADNARVVLRGRDIGPGVPNPVNWVVVLAVTTFNTDCDVEVFGSRGANGTVILQMPNGRPSNVRMAQSLSGFGQISIDFLDVRIECVDAVRVHGGQGVSVNVNRVPCDGHLAIVADAISPISVVFQNLRSNALLVNAVAQVPRFILDQQTLVVGAGRATRLMVDGVTNGTSHVNRGCMTVNGAVTRAIPSVFLDMVAQYVPFSPSVIVPCNVYAYDTLFMSVGAPTVLASNIQGAISQLDVTASRVEVQYDPDVLGTLKVVSNVLDVDKKFSVAVHGQGPSVLVQTGDVAELNFVCDNPVGVHWTFGDSSTTAVLSWEEPNGGVYGSIHTDFVVGLVNLSGTTSQVIASVLHLESNAPNQTLDISNNNVSYTSENTTSDFIWSPTLPVALTVQLLQGTHVVRILEKPRQDQAFHLTPQLNVAASAQASVHLESSSAVTIPADHVTFDKNQFTIRTQTKSSDDLSGVKERYCLAHTMCYLTNWVGVAAHGGKRCQSVVEQRNCLEDSAIFLVTPHRIQCHPTGDPNIFLLQNDIPEHSTPRVITLTGYGIWLMTALYAFAIAIAVTAWTHRGVVIADFLIPITISAALSPLVINHSGDPYFASIVEVSREIIGNLYTGWDCGFQGINNNCPELVDVVIFAEISLAVVWLGCCLYLLKWKYLRVVVIARRVVSGLSVFLVLPIAALRLHPTKHGVHGFALFVVLVNCLFFIFDAWYHTEAQEDGYFVPGARYRPHLMIEGIATITFLSVPIAASHFNPHPDSATLFALCILECIFHAVTTTLRTFYAGRLFGLHPVRVWVGMLASVVSNLVFGVTFISLVYTQRSVSKATQIAVWVLWAVALPLLITILSFGHGAMLKFLSAVVSPNDQRSKIRDAFRRFTGLRPRLPSRQGELRERLREDDSDLLDEPRTNRTDSEAWQETSPAQVFYQDQVSQLRGEMATMREEYQRHQREINERHERELEETVRRVKAEEHNRHLLEENGKLSGLLERDNLTREELQRIYMELLARLKCLPMAEQEKHTTLVGDIEKLNKEEEEEHRPEKVTLIQQKLSLLEQAVRPKTPKVHPNDPAHADADMLRQLQAKWGKSQDKR